VSIAVAVGRNADEVQRILRGEDVTRRREEEAEAPPEQERARAEVFFEPEAVEARPNKDDAPAAQNAEAAAQPKQ